MANQESLQPERPVQAAQLEETDVQEGIDLVALLFHLLNKWWIILLCAILCAGVMGYRNKKSLVPRYSATATIYVVGSKDSVINLSDLSLGSTLAADYLKIFNTWELQAAVRERLGDAYVPGSLSISNAESTRMLDLTVTSSSAEGAASLANAYAEIGSEYIEDKMQTTRPSIISKARVPSGAYNLNYRSAYTRGFMIGAAAAVIVLAVFFLLDDKIKTSDEIRRCTGLVTLALVPVENGNESSQRHSGHGREAK